MATPNRRPAPAGDDRRLRELAEAAEKHRSSPAEQSRLLKLAAAGDREAERRLFDENLNMVLRTARRRVAAEPPDGLTEDELIQEGSLGLLAAIHSHAAAGSEFGEHAERAVITQMDAASAARREAIAGDAQLVADAEAFESAELSIRKLKGRAATVDELAQKLEWPVEKTKLLAAMVAEARRQHDEELLAYLDPGDISLIDVAPRDPRTDG